MVARMRFPVARRGALRRAAGHALGAVAVLTVLLIGNLRVQASEPVPRVTERAAESIEAPKPVGNDWQLTSVRGESAIEGSADALELVPAIYAWNPDVRFVYYRHVSKWM